MHVYAIDRARGHAEVATGAFINNHRVHQFCRTDNGIHWTGLDALGAADAFGFSDVGHLGRGGASLGIKLQDGHGQQLRQSGYGFIAAWRAFVDRFAVGNAFGVGFATWMTALAALGLRQQGIDTLNQAHALTRPTTRKIVGHVGGYLMRWPGLAPLSGLSR
jgi:hypothetical protein